MHSIPLENTGSVVPVGYSAIQRDNIWEIVSFFPQSVYIEECTSDCGGRQDHELKKLELYF